MHKCGAPCHKKFFLRTYIYLAITQPLCGIKGLSALHILPSFDVVNGIVIDYMHCVLEGVGKKLMNLWFSVVGHPYYIKRHMSIVNARLLGIKPPDTITRTPRGIDQVSRWKGRNIHNPLYTLLMCPYISYSI